MPYIVNGAYKFKTPSNILSRYQGQSIILSCMNLKFEQNGRIIWRKNNLEFSKGSHINDFHELELNDLKLNDAGIYECVSSNMLVLTIELNVLSKLLMPIDSIDDNYDANTSCFIILFSIFSFLVLFYFVSKLFNEMILKAIIKNS